MTCYNSAVCRTSPLPSLGSFFFLLLFFSALICRAEESKGLQLRFQDESSVSWVLTPVVVRNSSGHNSSGRARQLRAEDFRLTVDGRPVPLMSFESGTDAPVRLIYLQDLSGSMANGGKLEASRAALRCFLEDSRPGDEFALVSFASGRTTFDVPLTTEISRLESALEGWRGHGTTTLHDAVARLPEVRAEDRSVRQAAVLVTDGGDNDSTLDPAEVRRILRAAELPVYVVDLGNRPAPGARVDSKSFAHVLRLLASATGGRYHVARRTARRVARRTARGVARRTARRVAPGKNSRSGGMNQETRLRDGMMEACRAISEDLRYQYVLGFQTRDVGPPTYRRIQVEIPEKKRFKLAHRQGYLGGTPVLSVRLKAHP